MKLGDEEKVDSGPRLGDGDDNVDLEFGGIVSCLLFLCCWLVFLSYCGIRYEWYCTLTICFWKLQLCRGFHVVSICACMKCHLPSFFFFVVDLGALGRFCSSNVFLSALCLPFLEKSKFD